MNKSHTLLALATLLLQTESFASDAFPFPLASDIATDTGSLHFTIPVANITNTLQCDAYWNSGTAQNDLILGRPYRDVIYANKDNWDYTNINAGNDAVFGGGGNDHIETGRTTSVSYVDGGEGDDKIYGTWVNSDDNSVGDVLIGGNGNDTIVSGAGDDIVYGGKGNDSLYNAAENGVRDSDNLYIYEGSYAEYTITADSNYLYISDSVDNRDGNDRIANGYREGTYSSKGDFLQFSDGQLNIKTLAFLSDVMTDRVTYGSVVDDNETLPDAIYLSDYDLDPADGVSNSVALQHALDDTPSGGTLIADISGEYAINESLLLTQPITLLSENRDFTLKLMQSDGEVIRIKSENVTIDGIHVNANQNSREGIYSDYGNLTIQNSKIHNVYYSDTATARVATGISIIPQSGENLNITLNNNEIYNITNTLHDQTEGSYGMARGIFIAYSHVDGANLTIEANHIHDIDAEEDDFIYIEKLDKNILSNPNHPYLTAIKNNHFIGFTRRALKIAVPNVVIENNIMEGKLIEDQDNYPSYSAITLFGSGTVIKNNTITLSKYFERGISLDTDGSVNIYNTTIEGNNITLEGGVKQQFAVQMMYRSFDYLVQNNTFTMIAPYYREDNGDKSSHFFYLKAYTRGEIKENTFTVQNGTASSVVHSNLYLSNTATNTTRLTNNRLVGDIDYYVQYQGLSLNSSTDTSHTEGYIVDVEYTGNRDSRETPVVTVSSL